MTDFIPSTKVTSDLVPQNKSETTTTDGFLLLQDGCFILLQDGCFIIHDLCTTFGALAQIVPSSATATRIIPTTSSAASLIGKTKETVNFVPQGTISATIGTLGGTIGSNTGTIGISGNASITIQPNPLTITQTDLVPTNSNSGSLTATTYTSGGLTATTTTGASLTATTTTTSTAVPMTI